MAQARFPDLASALQGVVAEVLRDGAQTEGVQDSTSVGSAFGSAPRPTRELLGHSFQVADPRACLVTTPVRRMRFAFAYAQWLWTMEGSDDLEAISHYNARGRIFSADGQRLPGSFGWRLRGPGRPDQLLNVIRRLRSDPQSRRAVALIAEPDDGNRATLDQPCALALQYLIRNDRLDAITYMRSQSAAMVLPYDAFLFMGIQCWLAAVLGVEPGAYHHLAGSLHVYEDELEVARALVDAAPTCARLDPMPDPERELERLARWERDLRMAVIADESERLETMVRDSAADSTFWGQARSVLEHDASFRLERPDLAETAAGGLDEALRVALASGNALTRA